MPHQQLCVNDGTKYTVSAALLLVLAMVSLAYTWGLGTLVERKADEAMRRARYEKAVEDRGLKLHPGAFWKEKR